ncbi:ATP-binding protein [Streptomyces sp. NPDC059002]|uniref:ATP-binding protein n=1 Tax=Streptomyces sp. NPDC059002 TaxID=3346690 RepID=UPI0036CF0539
MRVRGNGVGGARPERSGPRTGGLIGRAEELGVLRRLLAQRRLVTVVGGAGVGKSLLAEHAAAAVGGTLADGVVRVRWWDGGPPRRRSVAQAVAEAIDGETEGTGAPPVGAADLAARLRSRRVLVVLDDFDPVRVECVHLVRALLEGAPGVRVLAAGRHPLGLGDEAVLRLGPLAVAPPGGGTDAGPGPAVALFLERARAARPGGGEHGVHRLRGALARARRGRAGWEAAPPVRDEGAPPVRHVPHGHKPPGPAGRDEPTGAARHADSTHDKPPPDDHPRNDPHRKPPPDDLNLALRICRRLEGMPLAIELAAAQVAEYSLGQVARMLEAGQGWLGVPDAALRRHRSLRAAVGAGYALCGPAERTTWARLSVFIGDFDEDAAVFVCAGGGLGAEEVPVCLARLVLASVLEPVRDPGGVLPPRYRMGEAVRGFGAERLQSAGETAAAVSRHLYWYGHVASSAHHLWSTGLHERATALVRDEETNLRAALARDPRSADDAAAALAVAVDLWFWWAVCGHAAEGREQLRRLLPLGRADTRLCGQALWLAGWLAVCVDAPDAAELLGQAWRVAVLAGDDATIGRVSHVFGALALEEGRTERAIAHLREAAETIPVHAEHGPPVAVSWALLAVAQARVRPGDARRSIRRASAEPQPRHDLWTRSMTQYAQAFVDHLRGRRSRAWRRAHKALAGAIGITGVTTPAGPPGAALIHQLITDIETGPPPA